MEVLFEKERKLKMFCEWSGNTTKLYCDNRQHWRTFNTRKQQSSLELNFTEELPSENGSSFL